MRELENSLREALARKQPPKGFSDRVLEAAEGSGRRQPRRMSRALSGIAAALLVVTIGVGAWMQHVDSVRERREAEQASVLVKLALHIASEKTNIARERLAGNARDGVKDAKGGENDETADD
jgi:hypothetical protein